MTYRIASGLLGLTLLLGTVSAQDTAPPVKAGGLVAREDDQQPTRITITVPAKPSRARALANALQIDPIDRVPGNAALLWLRAGRMASQVKRVITEEEYSWANPWRDGTPLNKVPQDKLAALLEPYAAALRVAHEAARRDHCDWGEAPFTIASLTDYLPLDEIQSMRTVANMLRFQHRLALARGDWKEALRISRTGLTLARHLGEGNLLITHLVAIAIQAVMMGTVEEMMTQPDAPNLYWALTDLPQPLVDVKRAIRYEMNTFHRSFPTLRKLEIDPDQPLSQGEILAIFSEVMRGFSPQEKHSALQDSLILTTLVGRFYGEAKRTLIERGMPAEKVEKLPTAQVVGLYFLEEYNNYRDEVLKLQNLPPWQAHPYMEALEKSVNARARERGNPFLLLMPALAKVENASVRSERNTVFLRTIEVIRLHASENGGQLPARLADIKVAPVPLDPSTGQTFDAYYKKTERGATLEVPPFPPLPVWAAHYYEFLSPEKEKP
jgi:hypothetical protein